MPSTTVMHVQDLAIGDVIYGTLGDERKPHAPRSVSFVRARTNLTQFRVHEGSDPAQGGELWELPSGATIHVSRPKESPCVRDVKRAISLARAA